MIVTINSDFADGRDPSWLWDVPFEKLAGRTVVATGFRRRDLAVRLTQAGVDHVVIEDPYAPGAPLPAAMRELDVRPLLRHLHGVPSPAHDGSARMTDPDLVIASIYADLLGTYGDGGNVHHAAAPGPTARHRHRGHRGAARRPGSRARRTSMSWAAARTRPRSPPARPCAPTAP